MATDKDLTQLTAETSPASTDLLYLLKDPTGTKLDRSVTPAVLVSDAVLATSDITTNDVSTSKHGFAPKLPNDAAKFLDGVGAYSIPGATNYLNYQDQKAQNTAGGTFTSGAWRTRTLNTEVADTGGYGTLASNQITLTAGTYLISASAPAYLISARHQTRLQNVTAGTTLLIGTSVYAPTISANTVMTRSEIHGVFTVAAGQALEIQHICQATEATDGFGAAANFTTEVYTVVELWKIG
jgi:hypothetical protein